MNSFYKGFFNLASRDLEVARVLSKKKFYSSSIYQSSQSFEKLVKACYIRVGAVQGQGSEQQLYDEVKDFEHQSVTITIDLLAKMADYEKGRYALNENTPGFTSNARYLHALELMKQNVDGFKKSLQKTRKDLLQSEIMKNLPNFGAFVSKKYLVQNRFRNNVSAITLSRPSKQFNYFLLTGMILSRCLFRMNEIARYPMLEFNYQNLFQTNNKVASEKILILVGNLYDYCSWIISNAALFVV